MRGIRTAGVGLALAVSSTPAIAQQPSPAATLGRAVADEPAQVSVVRAAAPDAPPTALFPRGLLRAQATPPAGGGTLPPPRPVDGQPSVTEQRGNPPVTGPVPNASGGTTVPFGVVPQPAYPNYVVPGSGGVVTGPVLVPACDQMPGGGMSIPVSPSAPAVTPGSAVPCPTVRLEDPYLAPYNPLLPRARNLFTGLFTQPLLADRLTLGGEYLLWFARAQDAPPLLSTSSPQFNGILGTGDSRVIFGNQALTNTLHSGARFSAAYRLNNLWSAEGNVWFLGRNAGEFVATSNQFPVLARPFFDVNNNRNSAQLIAAPNLSTGSGRINFDTSLWGAEANLRRAVLCGPCSHLDLLVGFRHFNLGETLQVTEQFARTANSNTGIGVPTALSGTVIDRFRTENHFYGVNVGLAGELRRSWWFLQGRAAVGLGSIYQSAQIDGSQTIVTTTGVQTAQGGLLALPGANIGSFNQTKFGVIPEVGLTVGLNLTPNLRFGVGYNFMYVNSVIRPVGLIDPGLDVRRIPNFPVTPTPPAVSGVRPSSFPFRTNDFFVQGVTFSLFWTW